MGTSEVVLPIVSGHRYWQQKQRFELAADRYSSWVVFAVSEGRFTYEIGEFSGEATAGHLVWCPPGELFKRTMLTPLTFHYAELTWSGAPPALPVCVQLQDQARLRSTLKQLARLAGREPGAGVTGPLLQHLIADLWLQQQLEEQARQEASVQARASHTDPVMEQAADWLLRSCSRKCQLRELADELKLTPVQLTRRFQLAYGVTPQQYLIHCRMQEAQRLLLESDWTLERIAEACGYENGFYLSRVFTRVMGMRPSLFRERYRIQV